MRRYRNARYAPESLERKLNPSGMGVVAPPVMVSPSVAPTDITHVTPPPVTPSVAPTNIVSAPPVMVSPTAAPVNSPIVIDYAMAGSTTMTVSSTLPYSAPTSDYLLVDDGIVPPPPGDGAPPILPPLVPTGPVVPA